MGMDGSRGVDALPETYMGGVAKAPPDLPPLDWPKLKHFLNCAARHGRLNLDQIVSAASDTENAWRVLIEHGTLEMRLHFKKKLKQFYLLYENLVIARDGTKIGPMPELVEPDEA